MAVPMQPTSTAVSRDASAVECYRTCGNRYQTGGPLGRAEVNAPASTNSRRRTRPAAAFQRRPGGGADQTFDFSWESWSFRNARISSVMARSFCHCSL
jgi:hypothetical protein